MKTAFCIPLPRVGWWSTPAVALLLGCFDPIVGAECKPGLVVCDHECVDIETDYRHCGGCGIDCGPYLCLKGRCSTEPRRDASALLDAGADSGPDGSALDAALPRDTGLIGCGVGEIECNGACIRPEEVNFCGACDVHCDSEQVCSYGVCADRCDPPLSNCGAVCVDFSSDPFNCGDCGIGCASGICESGSCADTTAGHLVVVGHDFTSATQTMRRIAGNAVFLARGSPVKVLVYEARATSEAITGTDQAIDWVAKADGRSWEREAASDQLVTLKLATADVLVVYAQQQASNSELQKLGKQWGVALSQFLRRGGVIVLFDGQGKNNGTYQILTPAQIFSAISRGQASGSRFTVVAPEDQIALGAPRQYLASAPAVHFTGVGTPADVVVKDTEGLPVILHRVLAP